MQSDTCRHMHDTYIQSPQHTSASRSGDKLCMLSKRRSCGSLRLDMLLTAVALTVLLELAATSGSPSRYSNSAGTVRKEVRAGKHLQGDRPQVMELTAQAMYTTQMFNNP